MRMICISNFVWKLGIIFYADNLFIWTASITLLSRVFDAIDLEWKEEISPVIQNWLGSWGWGSLNFSPWILLDTIDRAVAAYFWKRGTWPRSELSNKQWAINRLGQNFYKCVHHCSDKQLQFLIPISLVVQEAMHCCLMAAANVHFTEYGNVFLPSFKVSADVAHRTFAGAQPAASSRPQPSESDTRQRASDTRLRVSRNSSQKAELCSARTQPGPGSDTVTSADWVCGSGHGDRRGSGSGSRGVRSTQAVSQIIALPHKCQEAQVFWMILTV